MLEETKTASVSSVARKHGIAKSLLFRWRRDAGLQGKKAKRTGNAFLPVVTPQMAPPSALPMDEPGGTIEIELARAQAACAARYARRLEAGDRGAGRR